jgi:hypothetical protein
MEIQMSNVHNSKAGNVNSMSVGALFRQLDSLSAIRADWEGAAYKTANDGLYDLLSKVYQVYEEAFVNGDAKSKKALKEELKAKLASFQMRTLKGTSVLGMLVRYVFRCDRKRNSRYLKAIEAANSHGKTAAELGDWLRECGGIDEVARHSKVNAEAEERNAALQAEIASLREAMHGRAFNPLARIELQEFRSNAAAVLITTPGADGSFYVTAVVEPLTDAVLKTLLLQQAVKNLEDKESLATMNKEAESFIKRSLSNDERALRAA